MALPQWTLESAGLQDEGFDPASIADVPEPSTFRDTSSGEFWFSSFACTALWQTRWFCLSTRSSTDCQRHRRGHADTGGHSQEPSPTASSSGQEQPDRSSARAFPIPTAARAASAAKGIRNWINRYLTQLSKHGSQSTQTALFCLHAMLITLALLHLQPLNRKLSHMAWMYFLQTSLVLHGFKVSLTQYTAFTMDSSTHATDILWE